MNNIQYLKFEDLHLVNNYIKSEKNAFDMFNKLGWSQKNIKSQFTKNNNLSIGYFIKKKLVGILIGEKIINNTNFDLEIHIMFVSKIMRRKKIGTSMLNFLDINKKLTNISKVYLEVSEDNKSAINFYEKNNFVFFNFRHNYYKINGTFINAVCYKKII